jgi:hypothetical protein
MNVESGRKQQKYEGAYKNSIKNPEFLKRMAAA